MQRCCINAASAIPLQWRPLFAQTLRTLHKANTTYGEGQYWRHRDPQHGKGTFFKQKIL
jgi:hypothetical protein